MIILRQKEKSTSDNFLTNILPSLISTSAIMFSRLLHKLALNNLLQTKKLSKNITMDKLIKYIKDNFKDLYIYQIPMGGSCYIRLSAIREIKGIDITKKPKIVTNKEDAMKVAILENKELLLLNYQDGPIVLAHELGHHIDLREKSLKQMDRRTTYLKHSEKIASFVSALLNYTGPIGSSISLITHLAINSPRLWEELKASYYGIEVLKKLGATEEDLKMAKKLLSNAFLTYFAGDLQKAGISGLIGGMGKFASANIKS